MMEYFIELENGDCIKNDTVPQSDYQCDLQGSQSTRMVVSDADDDDASVARHAKHTVSSKGNADAVNVGSTSSEVATDSMVVDGPHRVTPLLQDSEEAMVRATPRGVTKIGNDTILPFCPSSFPFKDDRQTIFTIQPRAPCEQSSQTKLVDKYAVKYDRRNHKESTERHDFNACGALKPAEDIGDAKKGIRRNLIDMNLAPIPHKIADGTTSTTIPNGQHNQTSSSLIQPQHHYQRKNLIQPQWHHKITSDEIKTNTVKMPYKAAPCLPRQRSRAIAIKRSRPGELIDTSHTHRNRMDAVDKEARRCDVELYDYATWRMYNRIIDHRRKNPLPTQLHQDDHSQDQQHGSRSLKSNQSRRTNQASAMDEHSAGSMMHGPSVAHGQRYFVRHNPLYTEDDYLSCNEDDEIFDFEL